MRTVAVSLVLVLAGAPAFALAAGAAIAPGPAPLAGGAVQVASPSGSRATPPDGPTDAPASAAESAHGKAPGAALDVAPGLPDLVLHTDALVRSETLERSGRFLRIVVAEYLLGRGPEELFVEDRAFEAGLLSEAGRPSGSGGAGWFVFLVTTREGLVALSACRDSVVPLAETGRIAADSSDYALAEPELAQLLRALIACRAPDGVARAVALVADCSGAPDAAHRLAGLQLAAEIARGSTSAPADAPLAALVGGEWAAGWLRGPALAPRLEDACARFPTELAPPLVTLRRLLADDAGASVEPGVARLGRAARLARALAASRQPPDALDTMLGAEGEAAPGRDVLQAWVEARRGELLALDGAFIARVLRRDDDPRTAGLARGWLAELTGGAVSLPDPAEAAVRGEVAGRLEAWCLDARAPDARAPDASRPDRLPRSAEGGPR